MFFIFSWISSSDSFCDGFAEGFPSDLTYGIRLSCFLGDFFLTFLSSIVLILILSDLFSFELSMN